MQIVANRLMGTMKKRLAQEGLKLDHFTLLMTLTEGEDLTQTELGQRTGQPNYAITRTLDALAEKGLVERRSDATSRRSHRVFLTSKGRALMPNLFKIVEEVNADFMQPLDTQERSAFVHLLRKVLG